MTQLREILNDLFGNLFETFNPPSGSGTDQVEEELPGESEDTTDLPVEPQDIPEIPPKPQDVPEPPEEPLEIPESPSSERPSENENPPLPNPPVNKRFRYPSYPTIPTRPERCLVSENTPVPTGTLGACPIWKTYGQPGNQIQFDWGDGHKSPWYDTDKIEGVVYAGRRWFEVGEFYISARQKNNYGYISSWSAPTLVKIFDGSVEEEIR